MGAAGCGGRPGVPLPPARPSARRAFDRLSHEKRETTGREPSASLGKVAVPSPSRRGDRWGRLQEAEGRHPGADALEEVTLGGDQLLGRPRRLAA